MSYTAAPRLWNHDLVIGDTYVVIVLVTDSAGVAYDISGATGECQIRAEPTGELLTSPVVSLVTNGTDGRFTWSLTPAQTEALAPARAQWSVRLEFADTTIRTILEGVVNIRRSVVS